MGVGGRNVVLANGFIRCHWNLDLGFAVLVIEASGLLFRLVRSNYKGVAAEYLYGHLYSNDPHYDAGRMQVVARKFRDYLRHVAGACKLLYVVYEGTNPMKRDTSDRRDERREDAAKAGKHGSAIVPPDCLVQLVMDLVRQSNIDNVIQIPPPCEYDSQALWLLQSRLATHAVVFSGDSDFLVMPPGVTTIYNFHIAIDTSGPPRINGEVFACEGEFKPPAADWVQHEGVSLGEWPWFKR